MEDLPKRLMQWCKSCRSVTPYDQNEMPSKCSCGGGLQVQWRYVYPDGTTKEVEQVRCFYTQLKEQGRLQTC